MLLNRSSQKASAFFRGKSWGDEARAFKSIPRHTLIYFDILIKLEVNPPQEFPHYTSKDNWCKKMQYISISKRVVQQYFSF